LTCKPHAHINKRTQVDAICNRLSFENAKRDDAAAKNELEAYIIKTRSAFAGDDEQLLKVCVCVCMCVYLFDYKGVQVPYIMFFRVHGIF